MTLQIRRADAGDASILTALMHGSNAYQGEYASILRGYSISPAQIDRDKMYVADTAGDLVGFYSLTGSPALLELDLLFVADAAQGTGLGVALFEHMRKVAKESGASEVKIVSHPPAESFYVRMGAVRVGVHPPSGSVTWNRPVMTLRL